MIIRKSYLNQRSRKQKTGHCSHVDINHLLIIPSIFQRPPNSHPWWGLEPHPGCVSMKPKKNENTNCHLKSWSTILNIIKLYNLHYISYQYISVNIIKLYFIIYIYQISRVIIYIYIYISILLNLFQVSIIWFFGPFSVQNPSAKRPPDQSSPAAWASVPPSPILRQPPHAAVGNGMKGQLTHVKSIKIT